MTVPVFLSLHLFFLSADRALADADADLEVLHLQLLIIIASHRTHIFVPVLWKHRGQTFFLASAEAVGSYFSTAAAAAAVDLFAIWK